MVIPTEEFLINRLKAKDNYWTHTKCEPIVDGRFKETGDEVDKYMFKVPTLRNVAMIYPYFHDGSIEKLEDAVGIIAKLNLNKVLTGDEVKSIIVFLNTLKGKVPEDVTKIPEKLNQAS